MVSFEIVTAILFCGLSSIFLVNSAVLPTDSSQVPIDSEPVVLVNPANAYIFGYQSDDGFGTTQHRHEVADGSGVVKGTYGYRDSFGIFRTVNYTADASGYRAVIRSNEPGFAAQNSGDVIYLADSPSPILAPPIAVRVKPPTK